MSQTIPAPAFLPVTIDISIPAKDMKLKKIVIKPTDSGADIKSIIEKKLADSGNPLVQYSKENILVIRK
jgi:hypothetical protein